MVKAPDKRVCIHILFFLFFHENMLCGYSLEALCEAVLMITTGFCGEILLLVVYSSLIWSYDRVVLVFTVHIFPGDLFLKAQPENIHYWWFCKRKTKVLSWKIKLFSCSTQLSMKFVLLINLRLLIIANSFLLNITGRENFSANKYGKANYCWHL